MTVGGERFVTFMYYLSTVEAGGHTVFPQAGVSGNGSSKYEDQLTYFWILMSNFRFQSSQK